MINRSESDIENPDLHLVKLFKNPKYIGSMVKMLFDIELHPIQIAILQEFWIRAFPMYIASRGWGKSFLLALFFPNHLRHKKHLNVHQTQSQCFEYF